MDDGLGDGGTSEGDAMIGFAELSSDEMYLHARAASIEVYERAQPIARKIAERYCKKYAWVSADDLTQNLMLEIPKIIYTFNPDNKQKNPWSKYLYFKLYFAAKDLLRKEDPLGISWPQKKAYPNWYRLQDDATIVARGTDADEMDEIDEFELDISNLRALLSGFPQVRKLSCAVAGKKKKRRCGLWTWRLRRARPKQMDLFAVEALSNAG
jgi:hypothetical protein